MDRREALRWMVIGPVGAAACGPAWVERLSAAALARPASGQPSAGAAGWTPRIFTPHQDATVVELSERIIPQTETAGARAARVNAFIDAVLDDAEAAEREAFLRGLDGIDRRSRAAFGVDFVDAPVREQEALLTRLAAAADAPADAAPEDREGAEFFQAIKRLTVTGYYTSEVGMREELGDDGTLVFDGKAGCAHPEHRGQA